MEILALVSWKGQGTEEGEISVSLLSHGHNDCIYSPPVAKDLNVRPLLFTTVCGGLFKEQRRDVDVQVTWDCGRTGLVLNLMSMDAETAIRYSRFPVNASFRDLQNAF